MVQSSLVLAISDGDGIAKFCPDFTSGENTFTQVHLHANGAVFSADGSLLLTISDGNGTAKIWASTGGENAFTRAHPHVNGAVFSADGFLVLTISDGCGDATAKIWALLVVRIPSHKLILMSMVQSSPLMALCCSQWREYLHTSSSSCQWCSLLR